MSPGEVVTAFIRAVEAKDLDGALALVADDCVYDNVPMGAVTGPDAIRATLGGFLGSATAVEWVIHHQVEQGDVVMNARLDRFEIGDRWLELPVAGVFEVRDGRLHLWRDYFDLGTFTSQLQG